jgi:hypothetical protein
VGAAEGNGAAESVGVVVGVVVGVAVGVGVEVEVGVEVGVAAVVAVAVEAAVGVAARIEIAAAWCSLRERANITPPTSMMASVIPATIAMTPPRRPLAGGSSNSKGMACEGV